MPFTKADNELTSAAYSGDLAAVQSALDEGGDPNKVNPFGRTAFNQAIKSGNIEVVRLLIKGGANVNLAAGGSHTAPLTYARLYAKANDRWDIVDLLRDAGALEEQELISKNRPESDPGTDGTPLNAIEQFESDVLIDGLASGFYNGWLGNIEFIIRQYEASEHPDSNRRATALRELLAHMNERMPGWGDAPEAVERLFYDYAEANREFINSISEKLGL